MKKKNEQCIICGIDTGIPVETDISERKNYINGAGQLCDGCYKKLIARKESIEKGENNI